MGFRCPWNEPGTSTNRAKVYVIRRNTARSARAARAESTKGTNRGLTVAKPQEMEQVAERHSSIVRTTVSQLIPESAEKSRNEVAPREERKYCARRVGVSTFGKEEKGRKIRELVKRERASL
ncbi:uncharacterized protein LOC123200560 [Mangifera indica]|uniref:uncharacterized protein LOC123200560 n=1 Tax=Mangifera indica TaxID=29780 RepID=UPI001CFA0FCB|nr:uncharacterized protein LOC123200560 [Mangifera indica]